MNVCTTYFGEYQDQDIYEYTLRNPNGITVKCINFGCIIHGIFTPNKKGTLENIVLGFETIDDYLKNKSYFGGVIGRVAGRIRNATYRINDKSYAVTQNNRNHHLHGGDKGFNQKIWHGETFQRENEAGVIFTYKSVDGEEGYGGNVEISVTYTLTSANELFLEYHGKADQETPLNLTNHSYFNLSGNCKEDILNHKVTINSSQFLEATSECLPSGKLEKCEGTPFDFRTGRLLSSGIEGSFFQNEVVGKGYDHGFILNEHFREEIVLEDLISGRRLVVETNQPCVVMYSGNFIEEGELIWGAPSRKYLGVCFETQGYPDALSHDNFPSIILKPGEEYCHLTKWSFY